MVMVTASLHALVLGIKAALVLVLRPPLVVLAFCSFVLVFGLNRASTSPLFVVVVVLVKPHGFTLKPVLKS